MKSEVIYIKKKSVGFREDALMIEKRVKKIVALKVVRTVYIDFSKVIFISRSFADELINVTGNLKKAGITLIYKNISANVKKMIDIVKSTRKNIYKSIASSYTSPNKRS
ncbi:MAG: hypothetical protein COX07_06430 [Bacteroidetes bacterium CG23_combo_of_CG06-09_8_20_14_all_32_9]|nr:MAG: hypothetical protein COX07_06430 [Bacteroidetes bacterium CG23_combo_of_CG06-09_8_20_14_all_32_9]